MTRQEILDAVQAGKSLSGAYLYGAYLRGADLRRADLSWANLKWANLERADLSWAELIGANLEGAKLEDANLEGANLYGAKMKGAYLKGANLKGAKMPSGVKVDGLHQKMFDAVQVEGALDMNSWHTCGTTHCRAGWAIVLAGQEGAELEKKYGPSVAGTIIYHNSTGMVPDFYCNNDAAMADIKACAGK